MYINNTQFKYGIYNQNLTTDSYHM